MKKLIRISFLAVILLFLLGASMWLLTSKWMKDGLSPAAVGENEYAIILGAKVNGDIPSLSLQYRLEAALDYGIMYPHVTFILSGGKGSDEWISEAEAMRRFLVENGIDESRLMMEDASTSTYENIHFSTKLIPHTVEVVTIITSDYHLARARKIAEKLGYETDAVAAKTPNVVKFQLKTRERIALLKTFFVGK